MSDKPWGGRFREETLRIVEQFTASIGFDRRMYRQDIRGSVAHARMLAAVGVLSEEEAEILVQGLERVLAEIERVWGITKDTSGRLAVARNQDPQSWSIAR